MLELLELQISGGSQKSDSWRVLDRFSLQYNVNVYFSSYIIRIFFMKGDI